MEKTTIKVYKHEARNPKELLDAIVFASRTMGIHRIINLSGRSIMVVFELVEGAMNVTLSYGMEEISETIHTSPNMIVDIYGAEVLRYDYEDAYARAGFWLRNGLEIVIFRWRATGMRQIMYVFRGGEEYERFMTLIDLWKLKAQ